MTTTTSYARRALAVSAAAVTLALPLAPAFAQSSGTLGSSVLTTATADAVGGGSGTPVQAVTLSTGAGYAADASDTSADDSADVTASDTTGSDVASVSDDAEASLSLSRSQLSSGDAAMNASGESAAAVISNDDLTAYARSAMTADPNIVGMQSSPNSASLSYTERAYFLGFIPSSITTTAQADTSGDVTLSYPWYRFLYHTDGAALQSSLSTEVQASLNDTDTGITGTIAASAGGSFDASTQAMVLEAMRAAMQAQHDTDFGAAISGSPSE